MGKYELRPTVKLLYQLRPEVSALLVSVAHRIVNPKHDELCPTVSGNCISCIESYGNTKCPTNGIFLQFYCTLLYTLLHANIQNC